MKRTFIHADDRTGKTWTVEANGASFTSASVKTRSFDSEAKCLKAA
jgi:hypothetical protein